MVFNATFNNMSTLSPNLNTNTILGGRGGRDRMVVGFATTYASSAYHHWCCEVKSRFSGGRSRNTRREPLTMGKQLVDFITCDWESSAPFLAHLANGRLEVGITGHNCGRGPSKDHSTKVWFKLAQWLQRSWLKCEKLTMRWNFNCSYMARSSLTYIPCFSVKFFFQPIYTDYAN
jgi:hypothetical protein